MTSAPRFELLGPLRARRDGTELDLGPGKQRAVLAVLLLERGRPVPTDRIVAAVWPDSPPANGANTVQKYVAGLRRVLEPERSPRSPGQLVVRTDSGYRIAVPPGGLDADAHADLVRQARAARDDGDLAGAAALLRSAAELQRGEPLAEFDGPAFDLARQRLVEDLAAARETAAEVALAAGRHREVVPELVRLVGDLPLREEPRALLMLALYRSGRQAEALEAYREARRFLAAELGVEPGDRLRDLQTRILRSDPTLAAPGDRPPVPAAEPAPPGPAEAAAASTPRRSWRPAGVLLTAVVLLSCGFLTFAVVGGLAARRHSRWLAVCSVAYLVAIGLFFGLFKPDDPNAATNPFGLVPWLATWFGGAAQTALRTVRVER